MLTGKRLKRADAMLDLTTYDPNYSTALSNENISPNSDSPNLRAIKRSPKALIGKEFVSIVQGQQLSTQTNQK